MRLHYSFMFAILFVSMNCNIAIAQSVEFKLSTPLIDSLILDFVYSNDIFSQQKKLRRILVLVEVDKFKSEPKDTVAIKIKNINFLRGMASNEIVSFYILDNWIACFMSVSDLRTGVFFPPVGAYKAFIQKINPWNYLTWFGEYDENEDERIATGDGTGCAITYYYSFYNPINEMVFDKDYRKGNVKYQYIEKRIDDECSGRKELIKYEFDYKKKYYRVLRNR